MIFFEMLEEANSNCVSQNRMQANQETWHGVLWEEENNQCHCDIHKAFFEHATWVQSYLGPMLSFIY